jgi:hypothetical protein
MLHVYEPIVGDLCTIHIELCEACTCGVHSEASKVAVSR